MLRVLTLSTLFPDVSRPNFAPFVERQTRALSARNDVDVRVVAPRGIPPLLGRHPRYRSLAAVADREDWRGLIVHRPRFAHLPSGHFDPLMIARSLTPVLCHIRHDFPFDVIDAQFFFPDGPAAIALGRRFGVPVSIKARGADIHFWGQRRATRGAVRAAGHAADGLLAVSEALKRDMVDLGMAADRITVHHTGIDHDIFRVRDRASTKSALGVAGPLIVSVGALIPRKGQGLVVAALRDLPGATLVLIGEGPDRAALEAEGTGLDVRLAGALPAIGVAEWLAAADVMALPSSSEGLANAWVEALASGTPIVIADAGGARELLDRPEAGRIVVREPAAIAAAIRAILADPPERAAVAATVAAMSWEANAAVLHAHLAGLVKRAQRRADPASLQP